MADAVRRGVERVVVGLGGSATCDAGQGMLQALIDGFSKKGEWDEMDELKRVHFTIASDVMNPLCGEHGAARVFAPQKGASSEMGELLEARARQFVEASARRRKLVQVLLGDWGMRLCSIWMRIANRASTCCWRLWTLRRWRAMRIVL